MRKKLILLVQATTCLLTLQAQDTDSLDVMIGQMIMIGINDWNDPGEKYDLLASIEQGRVGGVILYEKNLVAENTAEQLAELVWSLQKGAEIPLFMSIDEEGGLVNRLKPKYGFENIPSAAALGKLNVVDSTYQYALKKAQLLDLLGFNVNYAPVVDVNVNQNNPVIGKLDRSFGRDHEIVTRHAAAFLRAHNEVNVATTLKHFPGHGSSDSDTHLGVAVVTDSWQLQELYPYKALLDSGLVTGIMTAHIINRTLDTAMLPATLSQKIISEALRSFLGFDGVVFSDDMHMGAISRNFGFEDAVKLAVNADVDVLLFSNNVFDYQLTTVNELHTLIKSMVENGEIDRATIEKSYNRILILKKQLGLLDSDYQKTLKKRLKKVN